MYSARIIQLLAYGLLPVLGIGFFGWDWRHVLILYWLENVTVGLRNVILIMKSESIQNKNISITVNGSTRSFPAVKNIIAGFFAVHYGGFTFVHGIFVFAIVYGQLSLGTDAGSRSELHIWPIVLSWLMATVIQTILTVKAPSSSSDSPLKLLFSPYKRIIALHLSIVLGVFLIETLNLPSAAALLLIGLHALLDIVSYRKKPLVPTIGADTAPPTI